MWSFFSRDPSKDFNYEILSPIEGPYDDNSIWKLNSGKRKTTGEPVSIFTYDIKKGNDVQLEIAKSAVKRLKTLRHPNVTMYLDSLETDKMIFLVTEYVEPLVNHLNDNLRSEKQNELEISWGLHQISKGINFLVNDCNLVHNNICIWSILRNQAGEWKLGGFEFVCSADAETPIKILSQLEKYNPPEKSDRSRRSGTKWSVDMWGLGCLVWEVFNGPLVKTTSLKNVGKIPKSLSSQYCELVSSNPNSRPNPNDFLRRCRSPGEYFNNIFINTLLFLEEIQIKDSTEKTKFFNHLTAQLDNFPSEICKYKILPQLINAYEFGNAGSVVLASMFKLGKLLDDEEYQKKIVPCVVKLFSSTDRATRARLLQQLEHFVHHLQPAIINDQIFPKILQGFLDTNPTIRENTVKAMLHLAPKLNYNNINVELMKHFSRLQAKDEQGGIRTNTTVCLGKIAYLLHPQSRQKMLISAFTRAMRDPFPPAKTAGILALAATQAYYPLNEIACKVIPALSCSCVDPDKSVRDQAFKTLKGFLGKLEKVSEDPTLAETMEAEVNSIASPTAADTAASWAGWAVMSLTSKFYKSDKNKAEKPSETTAESSVKSETPVTVPDKKNKGQSVKKPESTSGSEDEWNDDWGQLDNKDEGTSVTSPASQENDGWADADDWGDEDAISPSSETETKVEESAWGDAEFVPIESNMTQISSYNWSRSETKEEAFFDNLMDKPQTQSRTAPTKTTTNWNVDEPWDNIDASSNKNKREERRLQREKELNEKRAARQSSGAMKLGEKKKMHPM